MKNPNPSLRTALLAVLFSICSSVCYAATPPASDNDSIAYSPNNISLMGGFSIVSNPYCHHSDHKGEPRFTWLGSISYDRFISKYFGIGLQSYFDAPPGSYTFGIISFKTRYFYIAPQFVARVRLRWPGWALTGRIGFGYATVTCKTTYSGGGKAVRSGLGANFMLGAQYLLSSKIGLRFDYGSFIGGNMPIYMECNSVKQAVIDKMTFTAGVFFNF